jgi:AcrR family transcriptional regulator
VDALVGAVARGEEREPEHVVTRLRAPPAPGRRIAVTGMRGSAGKTTVRALLSAVLAEGRPDPVLAPVDAEQSASFTEWLAAPEPPIPAQVLSRPREASYSTVDRRVPLLRRRSATNRAPGAHQRAIRSPTGPTANTDARYFPGMHFSSGAAPVTPPARSFTASARRARIVRAAIRTLSELGPAQISFERVTEQAGLSDARMVAYHFTDEDDLLQQIAEDVHRAGTEYVHSQVRQEASPTGGLRAYLESSLEFLRDHPSELAALREIGPRSETASADSPAATSEEEAGTRALEPLLRQGQETGEFGDFDPGTMAFSIRTAIAATKQQLIADPQMDVNAHSRELVTSFLAATSRGAVAAIER